MESQSPFALAARQLVDDQPWGARKELARAVGIGANYVTDMLQGRRNINDRHKENIAQALGCTVPDMLIMGEEIRRGLPWFPWTTQMTVFDRPTQAKEILRLTVQQFGITNVGRYICPDEAIVERFCHHEISPGQLYHHYRDVIRTLARALKEFPDVSVCHA